MEQEKQIIDLLQARISKESGTPVIVDSLRVGYENSGPDNKSVANLSFKVNDASRELKPEEIAQYTTKALSTIDALQEHIKFESKTCHMTRMADDLAHFIQAEATLNEKTAGERFSTIPRNAPDWFKELPKRNEWSVQHALNVEKKNTGVIDIAISAPKDVDSAVIVKNLEDRKDAILETLAKRVVKYTPEMDTPEKKAALEESVKKLNVVVSAQESDRGKKIIIQILSDLQLEASKAPSGFNPERIAEYVASNPLAALQNGENDKDPNKPQPHLQKALARSILFAGEKATEIFPLIAGKEDMARAVGKSLTHLKNKANNPELSKKIDTFLADGVFKDSDSWGKPIEERQDKPRALTFTKNVSDTANAPYEKGVMEVTIPLPGDKFPEILAKMTEAEAKVSAEASTLTATPTPQLEALAAKVNKLDEKLDHIAAHLSKPSQTPPILQMLADKNVITPEQQQQALAYAKENNILSGQAAVTLGCAPEATVDKALKEQAAARATSAPTVSSADEPAAEPQPDPMARQIKIAKGAIEKVLTQMTGQSFAEKAAATARSASLGL